MAKMVRAWNLLTGPSADPEEPTEASSAIPQVFAWAYALTFAVAATFAAAHLSYAFVFDYGAPRLNLDAERNPATVASSAATLAAGVGAALWGVRDRSRRWRMLGLASIFTWFAIDDMLELHEVLGERATQDLFGLSEDVAHAVWPAVFLPLLGLAFLLLFLAYRASRGRIRSTLGFGIALLVVGIGAEMLAAAWYGTGHGAESAIGALQITVEETAEIAGWMLLATGLLVGASSQRVEPRGHDGTVGRRL